MDESTAVKGRKPWVALTAATLVSVVLVAFPWKWGWVSTASIGIPVGLYYAWAHDEHWKIDGFNQYTLRA